MTAPTRRDRTRVRRTPPPTADPGTCLCPTGPTTVAVFHDGDLVDVQRRHLLTSNCGRAVEHIDPADYQADIRRRR